jgi:tetratricopeptide (TPR) repeat protein
MRFDRHVKLLQGLPVEDGVALLRDLDPNSDYGLRDASEERLAKAVETVHGTPRALEVLAGILANDPFVSLEEVLEKFYGHEDVVHALIEENYRRLDRDARRVVEALAIFRKPVPVLAIDYLLKPFAPGLDVPGIVRWLSRSNIVSVDRVTKMVTLHPIDQDYAYSQLPEEGEAELAYTRQALERRAADYYAQLRTPEDAWKSIDDLDPQLNEFEFRIRVGDYDEACCILKSIDADHLYLWGHYTRLFTMREQLLGRLKSKCLEMDNLGSFGRVCYGLGLYEKSRSLHFRALAISRELKDLREEALQLGRLGVTYRELGWDEEAIAYHKRSLGIARKIDDPEIESLQFGRLSIAYRMMQEVEQALEYNQLAIAKAQDPRRIGNWIGSLGLVYRKLGQFRKAVKCHSKAMSIVVTEGDRRSEGSNIGNLGLVYRQLGMVEESVDQYEKALLIATEIGDRRREAIWLHRIGAIAYDLGQMTRAVEYFEESLSISVDIKHPAGESFCLLGLGKALLVSGDLSRAQSSCRKALDLDVASTGYQAALALGLVLLHQQTSPATKEFSKTIQLCRGLLERTAGLYQARYTLSAALVGQAVCDPLWTEEGERLTLLAPALEEYRRALDITAAPGVVQDAIGVLELIQAAEIEGLKPVFDLLENAEYKPDEVPPDFLADLS